MISAIERFIAAKALEKMKVRCQTLGQCLDGGAADRAAWRQFRRSRPILRTWLMEEDMNTLRITHSPDGQWFGRLLIGSEEIVLGAYRSPREVEQIANEIGLHPDRVEIEG